MRRVPWKETCRVDQKRQFILEWRSGTMSRAALCQLFGISRQTGYKWVRRFRGGALRWTSLEERSRRPKRSPRATPGKLVKLIVSQRRQFPRWGPRKLRQRLREQWPRLAWPSASTIGAILKRHGLVADRKRRVRLPPRTRPFVTCREPNDLWCVDFKGQFETKDGELCYPLTVMDGASRFLLACTAFRSPTLANVRAVFEELFRDYGLPRAIRSDNGEPFVSVAAAAGLTKLSAWWARLGINLERIDPGKPQQNGRHERMHLTLKMETCSPPRHSLGWQQRAFDRFRQLYNHVRPHDALGLATPASIYEPSPRRLPDRLPVLRYPFADEYLVKRDGAITLGRRRFFITTALAGECVGVAQLNARYAQVLYSGVLLGLIDYEQLHLGLIRPKQRWARFITTKVSAICPV